ncbi:hypothetical protein HJ590_14420 [Naumannella sp. ID2617S]|nr:hypothetical protein [Naumannella sp. ID2617S]
MKSIGPAIKVALGGHQPAVPMPIKLKAPRAELGLAPDEDPDKALFLLAISEDGTRDLVPGHYDAATQTFNAQLPHLSLFSFIRIDWRSVGQKARDYVLQTTKIESARPACVDKPVSREGIRFSVISAAQAWACVQQDGDRIGLSITPNTPVTFTVKPRPAGSASLNIQGDGGMNLPAAIAVAAGQAFAPGEGAVIMGPGVKVVGWPAQSATTSLELAFTQAPEALLLMVLGAVIQVVGDAIGAKLPEYVGNISKLAQDFERLACWTDVAQAAESLQRGLTPESAAKITISFFTCGGPVILNMVGQGARGPAAVILGIITAAPALFSGTVIGAITGLDPNLRQFTIKLERTGTHSKGEVFSPSPREVRSVAEAGALLPPDLATFAAEQFRRDSTTACASGRKPVMSLDKMRAYDLVSGSVSLCFDGYAFLWAKTDGRWKVAWAGMGDPECAELRRSGVSAIPTGFTGAECVEDGQLVPYRSVSPTAGGTCSVPVELFRQGLGNPEVVIRGTRCSRVDPSWARVELAASAHTTGATSSNGLGFAHRVDGDWVYGAAGFRNGRFCEARTDPTFPADFRNELAALCP